MFYTAKFEKWTVQIGDFLAKWILKGNFEIKKNFPMLVE